MEMSWLRNHQRSAWATRLSVSATRGRWSRGRRRRKAASIKLGIDHCEQGDRRHDDQAAENADRRHERRGGLPHHRPGGVGNRELLGVDQFIGQSEPLEHVLNESADGPDLSPEVVELAEKLGHNHVADEPEESEHQQDNDQKRPAARQRRSIFENRGESVDADRQQKTGEDQKQYVRSEPDYESQKSKQKQVVRAQPAPRVGIGSGIEAGQRLRHGYS
jgi:hypothetical protein